MIYVLANECCNLLCRRRQSQMTIVRRWDIPSAVDPLTAFTIRSPSKRYPRYLSWLYSWVSEYYSSWSAHLARRGEVVGTYLKRDFTPTSGRCFQASLAVHTHLPCPVVACGVITYRPPFVVLGDVLPDLALHLELNANPRNGLFAEKADKSLSFEERFLEVHLSAPLTEE